MGEVDDRERVRRRESRVVRGQGVRKDGKWGKWRIRKDDVQSKYFLDTFSA